MRCPNCRGLAPRDPFGTVVRRCVDTRGCGWVSSETPKAAAEKPPPDSQGDLFRSDSHTFGPAYDPDLDADRLRGQHERIRDWMLEQWHRWATLAEVATATGYPEASISAQLRHLRKPEFGAYRVEKRRRQPEGGCWEYRVTPPRRGTAQWEPTG